MKIYFAGSIRGGRDTADIYLPAIRYLQAQGHEVLSEHVAYTSAKGEQLRDTEIHDRDIAWIDECDVVIAEVTAPSLGVGYELAYAKYVAKKPVLCFVKAGSRVSAMILGGGFKISAYDTVEYLLRWFEIAQHHNYWLT